MASWTSNPSMKACTKSAAFWRAPVSVVCSDVCPAAARAHKVTVSGIHPPSRSAGRHGPAPTATEHCARHTAAP